LVEFRKNGQGKTVGARGVDEENITSFYGDFILRASNDAEGPRLDGSGSSEMAY
jgi:hypothetical protein